MVAAAAIPAETHRQRVAEAVPLLLGEITQQKHMLRSQAATAATWCERLLD
jgi:hypothetical protein